MASKEVIDQLKRKHKQHKDESDYWSLLYAIMRGGSSVSKDIKKKLLLNPDGRSDAVINERVKCAPFVPKISTVLHRFNSQLFSKEPSFEGSEKPWKKVFLDSGCHSVETDHAKISFKEMLYQACHLSLIQQSCICQLDTSGGNFISAEEQSTLGGSTPRAYLMRRDSLWDWEGGADGLRYAKIHKFRIERKDWRSYPEPVHEICVYEQEGDVVYGSRYEIRKIFPSNEERKNDSLKPFLEDCQPERVNVVPLAERQVLFNLDGRFSFPIKVLIFPFHLWLADKLYDLQVEAFNVRAGINWKLATVNFSMPMVTGGDEDPFKGRTFGDGYYMWLPNGYNYGSFEPSQGALNTAIEYLGVPNKDIFEILQQAAVQEGADVLQLSGEAIKQIREIEKTLLKGYGALMKGFAKEILDCCSVIANDGAEFTVSGWEEFDYDYLLSDFTELGAVRQQNIPSDKFQRKVLKDMVQEYSEAYEMDDLEKDEIFAEIDSAPSEKLSLLQPPQQEQPPNANNQT